MAKSMEARDRFVELRAEGWTLSRISEELGVSKPTLIKWSKEGEAAITLGRYSRMEEISERLGLLRESRLQAFGELLARVREELAKRSLDDIPTLRLVTMALDLERRISEDMERVRYHESDGVEAWLQEQVGEYTICLSEQ